MQRSPHRLFLWWAWRQVMIMRQQNNHFILRILYIIQEFHNDSFKICIGFSERCKNKLLKSFQSCDKDVFGFVQLFSLFFCCDSPVSNQVCFERGWSAFKLHLTEIYWHPDVKKRNFSGKRTSRRLTENNTYN